MTSYYQSKANSQAEAFIFCVGVIVGCLFGPSLLIWYNRVYNNPPPSITNSQEVPQTRSNPWILTLGMLCNLCAVSIMCYFISQDNPQKIWIYASAILAVVSTVISIMSLKTEWGYLSAMLSTGVILTHFVPIGILYICGVNLKQSYN